MVLKKKHTYLCKLVPIKKFLKQLSFFLNVFRFTINYHSGSVFIEKNTFSTLEAQKKIGIRQSYQAGASSYIDTIPRLHSLRNWLCASKFPILSAPSYPTLLVTPIRAVRHRPCALLDSRKRERGVLGWSLRDSLSSSIAALSSACGDQNEHCQFLSLFISLSTIFQSPTGLLSEIVFTFYFMQT